MSERACIRGCTVPGVHYATCADFGKTEDTTCAGCAPAVARDKALVCDRCFRRLRGLLLNAADLVGRLRSLADPSKAKILDRVRVTSSAEVAPAPVSPDLLDAVRDVQGTLRSWAVFLGGGARRVRSEPSSAYEDAHDAAVTILGELDRIVNDRDQVVRLAEGVLNLHPLVDGERPFWSVADAMGRFGAERRTKDPVPEVEESERLVIVEPVSEWGDPLLNREDAETLAGSARTLRRWVKDGDIAPAGEIRVAGVRTRLFRTSELLAVRERMEGRQRAGRFTGEG